MSFETKVVRKFDGHSYHNEAIKFDTHDYRLSIQANKWSYCHPRKDSPSNDFYESFEVAVLDTKGFVTANPEGNVVERWMAMHPVFKGTGDQVFAGVSRKDIQELYVFLKSL